MDITGTWTFTEDFGYGYDKGTANFVQSGHELSGVLEFVEHIDDDLPFTVRCQITGEVHGNKVSIDVSSFEITESSEPIEYYPERREGLINADGQIVGSSEDTQDICGVFVFTRV